MPLGAREFADKTLPEILKSEGGKVLVSNGFSAPDTKLDKGGIFPNSYIDVEATEKNKMDGAHRGAKTVLKKEPSVLAAVNRGMKKMNGLSETTLGEQMIKTALLECKAEAEAAGEAFDEVSTRAHAIGPLLLA